MVKLNLSFIKLENSKQNIIDIFDTYSIFDRLDNKPKLLRRIQILELSFVVKSMIVTLLLELKKNKYFVKTKYKKIHKTLLCYSDEYIENNYDKICQKYNVFDTTSININSEDIYKWIECNILISKYLNNSYIEENVYFNEIATSAALCFVETLLLDIYEIIRLKYNVLFISNIKDEYDFCIDIDFYDFDNINKFVNTIMLKEDLTPKKNTNLLKKIFLK